MNQAKEHSMPRPDNHTHDGPKGTTPVVVLIAADDAALAGSVIGPEDCLALGLVTFVTVTDALILRLCEPLADPTTRTFGDLPSVFAPTTSQPVPYWWE
jgi:hypothetical protein